MNRCLWVLLTVIIVCTGFVVGSWGESLGTEANPSKNQKEVTIVHVDKYGVYVPNIVFYWDQQMGKQKIDSLMSTAEKFRNKQVIITYISKGSLDVDKIPILVDISIVSDKSVIASTDVYVASKNEASKYINKNESKNIESKPDEQYIIKNNVDYFKSNDDYDESNNSDYNSSVSYVNINKEEVVNFIVACIGAVKKRDMNSIMACYGDRVDYYSNGVVGKDGIKRDKGYYFNQWDRIDSSIEGNIVFIVTDQENVRIAKFISKFAVENAKRSAKGRAENVWKIQRTDRGFKIIDEKQKIISREPG